MPPKPVLLFAFANDPQEFLPDLKTERQAIEGIFQGNEQVEIKVLPDASAKDIVATFLSEYFDGRIIGFHYSGHADEDAIMLKKDLGQDNSPVSGKSLAAFLGGQSSLQFVFLNGCATGPQVDALFEAGIGNVIATERKVNDGIAAALSRTFYQQLKKPEASITKAFQVAQTAIELSYDKAANPAQSWTRGLSWKSQESDSQEFAWKHFHTGAEPSIAPFLEPNAEAGQVSLEQIRQWIGNGDFNKATDGLKEYTKDLSSSDKNMVIMLSAQARDYEREDMRGTLRDPERRLASLRYRFLSFVDSLE